MPAVANSEQRVELAELEVVLAHERRRQQRRQRGADEEDAVEDDAEAVERQHAVERARAGCGVAPLQDLEHRAPPPATPASAA